MSCEVSTGMRGVHGERLPIVDKHLEPYAMSEIPQDEERTYESVRLLYSDDIVVLTRTSILDLLLLRFGRSGRCGASLLEGFGEIVARDDSAVDWVTEGWKGGDRRHRCLRSAIWTRKGRNKDKRLEEGGDCRPRGGC